jgi:hypothetical protein
VATHYLFVFPFDFLPFCVCVLVLVVLAFYIVIVNFHVVVVVRFSFNRRGLLFFLTVLFGDNTRNAGATRAHDGRSQVFGFRVVRVIVRHCDVGLEF